MSKKYLLKIEFDCNDADYVYGCKIINEEEKDIIEANGNKLVSFGSYDFGGGTKRTADEVFSITELTEEHEKMLTHLGLNSFGEGRFWNPKELLSSQESDDDFSEESEENEESDSAESNKTPVLKNVARVLIKRNFGPGFGCYYLKQKNSESNRETVHTIFGIQYERIGITDRATVFMENEALDILKELDSPEFEIIQV